MTTADYFFVIVIGWPSIICSALLLIAGVAMRKPGMSLAGALTSTGFCLYVAGGLWWLGLLFYACNWGSYYYMRNGIRRTAALLVVPFVMFSAYFGVAVLLQ